MTNVEIWCDAACDNNSKLKLMGIGVVVHFNGERATSYDHSEMMGSNGTNNIGEYYGFQYALKLVDQLNTLMEGDCNFRIYSDSQLVVNQFKREWDCNQPHLQELLDECWKTRRELNIPSHRLRIQWVRRNLNKEADELSKKAITDYKNMLQNEG